MRKTIIGKVLFLSVTTLLLLSSCKTGSNAGSDNENTDPNPEDHTASIVNAGSLVGSWFRSDITNLYDSNDYDNDGDKTEVIGADTHTTAFVFSDKGSFTMIDGEI